MENLDLVIVGAGWYGLAVAKTYTELNPNEKVVIVDDASTVGGVWSKERLYPGLKTNNMLGTYEFSDFPMDTKTYGVKPGEHIPGSIVHDYMSNFAQTFNIHHLIRFNTKVLTAEEQGDSWLLNLMTSSGESRVIARRLVVATGVTSEPLMPQLPGMSEFEGALFHPKDFKKYGETIKTATSVTVLGSSKSAWDVAYAYASSGVTVHWIIRASGHGPVWMAPPYVTPLKKWLEKLIHTRFLTWFSPSIWGPADGFPTMHNFFHRTWLGRKIVDIFFNILGSDVVALNEFDKNPETKKLKPWSDAFWIGNGLSILNYDTNIFDLVRDGKIKVHIADIDKLSQKTVHLSIGEVLETDVLILATGWKHAPPIKFLPAGIESSLGIPYYEENSSLDPMVQKADEEIFSALPRLRDQPIPKSKLQSLTPTTSMSPQSNAIPNVPFRLYRFMVPPTQAQLQSRSLAFAGALYNISTTLCAQSQALWLSAYFEDQISNIATSTLTPEKAAAIRYTTILHSQGCRWRHPSAGGGFGELRPDLVFESLGNIDMLMGDLGLKVQRKGGMNEWFSPYGVEDYRGLTEEWLKLQKRIGESKKIV